MNLNYIKSNSSTQSKFGKLIKKFKDKDFTNPKAQENGNIISRHRRQYFYECQE